MFFKTLFVVLGNYMGKIFIKYGGFLSVKTFKWSIKTPYFKKE